MSYKEKSQVEAHQLFPWLLNSSFSLVSVDYPAPMILELKGKVLNRLNPSSLTSVELIKLPREFLSWSASNLLLTTESIKFHFYLLIIFLSNRKKSFKSQYYSSWLDCVANPWVIRKSLEMKHINFSLGYGSQVSLVTVLIMLPLPNSNSTLFE